MLWLVKVRASSKYGARLTGKMDNVDGLVVVVVVGLLIWLWLYMLSYWVTILRFGGKGKRERAVKAVVIVPPITSIHWIDSGIYCVFGTIVPITKHVQNI